MISASRDQSAPGRAALEGPEFAELVDIAMFVLRLELGGSDDESD
jgi:hypothetical protein